MPTRTARAAWTGTIKGGSGTFEGESGVIQGNYNFNARFGDEKGTNPEEMLAAAEAACFSMALSGNLERNGTPSTKIFTDAACSIVKDGDGFKISMMQVRVRAQVDGLDNDAFKQLAQKTLDTCPVSRVMHGNVEFTLDAELIGPEIGDGQMFAVAGGGNFPNIRV